MRNVMKNQNAIELSRQRINDLALYMAEFALDFLPGDADVNVYDANDFLALINEWFPHFLQYAETNRMLEAGEKEALVENDGELISVIKESAVDAAREIVMEKI